MERAPITLLTDFGLADYYVAAMKGVIQSISPGAQVIDISHEVEPFDIQGAALLLHAASRYFPPRTIHVAVVDPGVGSARRPILVLSGGSFFIGPDNGVFTLICRDNPEHTVYELDQTHYHRQPEGGPTFHGRDIFAPVAAHLLRVADPTVLGTRVEKALLLDLPWPAPVAGGRIEGTIVHVDRFGNLVSNISRAQLQDVRRQKAARTIRMSLDDLPIRALVDHYGQCSPGVPSALFGGLGYLEVALQNDSAARVLGKARGARLVVSLGSD